MHSNRYVRNHYLASVQRSIHHGAVRNPAIRASDEDRQAMVDVLSEHTAAGRLTLSEFEERAAAAYAAKLIGDLDRLTRDLPALPDRMGSSRPRGRAPAPWRRAVWRAWLRVAVFSMIIWGAASLASGNLLYFWPIWVFGPWGAMLLWGSLSRHARAYAADEQRRRR